MDANDSKVNTIIEFPDFAKLKTEVERMRTELSMLLLERDELKLVICKNIEMEYMLKLGSLEYKEYELQCDALRLKRKIELIQAKKNRQEKIILSEIDRILDAEFEEYMRLLEEQIKKMNEALKRSECRFLNDEEEKELKKLYRQIVKALHPDLNPDVSEEKMNLFENAVQAYKNGDLATLRIIAGMVGDELPELHTDSLTQLADAKKHLEESLEAIRKDIERIKSEYPYTLKEIIDDELATEQRKQELEENIKNYKELISIYNQRIEEMLR